MCILGTWDLIGVHPEQHPRVPHWTHWQVQDGHTWPAPRDRMGSSDQRSHSNPGLAAQSQEVPTPQPGAPGPSFHPSLVPSNWHGGTEPGDLSLHAHSLENPAGLPMWAHPQRAFRLYVCFAHDLKISPGVSELNVNPLPMSGVPPRVSAGISRSVRCVICNPELLWWPVANTGPSRISQ